MSSVKIKRWNIVSVTREWRGENKIDSIPHIGCEILFKATNILDTALAHSWIVFAKKEFWRWMCRVETYDAELHRAIHTVTVLSSCFCILNSLISVRHPIQRQTTSNKWSIFDSIWHSLSIANKICVAKCERKVQCKWNDSSRLFFVNFSQSTLTISLTHLTISQLHSEDDCGNANENTRNLFDTILGMQSFQVHGMSLSKFISRSRHHFNQTVIQFVIDTITAIGHVHIDSNWEPVSEWVGWYVCLMFWCECCMYVNVYRSPPHNAVWQNSITQYIRIRMSMTLFSSE